MNLGDDVNASAARIIFSRGAEMKSSRQHSCRRVECMPLCEQDLVNDGRLRMGTRLINSCVYVCKYGQIHVCSPDRCHEYIGDPNGTCHITGLHHGNTEGERAYVPPEKRTAHFKKKPAATAVPTLLAPVKREREAEPPPPRAIIKLEPGLDYVGAAAAAVAPAERPVKKHHPGGNRRKAVPLDKRSDEAENIVTQLLYSKVRNTIIAAKREKLEKEKRRAIKAYYAERERKTFPIWAEVVGIKAICDMDLPQMRKLKRNDQRIERYVKIIMRSWEIVIATPWGAQNPGLKFVAHALSVLYKMRKGLTIKGMEFLPFDEFLFHLPVPVDLPQYDPALPSNMVTEGMKNLESAYRSALAAGIPPNDLALDPI